MASLSAVYGIAMLGGSAAAMGAAFLAQGFNPIDKNLPVGGPKLEIASDLHSTEPPVTVGGAGGKDTRPNVEKAINNLEELLKRPTIQGKEREEAERQLKNKTEQLAKISGLEAEANAKKIVLKVLLHL